MKLPKGQVPYRRDMKRKEVLGQIRRLKLAQRRRVKRTPDDDAPVPVPYGLVCAIERLLGEDS